MKVHGRTTWSFCNGEAYLPVREAISYTGERYTQRSQVCRLPWAVENRKNGSACESLRK